MQVGRKRHCCVEVPAVGVWMCVTSIQAEHPVRSMTESWWEGEHVMVPEEVGTGVLIRKGGGPRLV